MNRKILCLLAALLLSSCSSTRLASEWRDASDGGSPPQKLAVIAVVKDSSISRLIEDEAVHRLPASAHAVAATREFGFAPGTDIQALKDKLQQNGFDAAVITRQVAIDEREIYHPPQTYFVENRPRLPPSAFAPYYRDFWHFYPYAVSMAVTPAYKTRESRYIIETVLYRLPEGKPVWSAVTETLNPSSTLVLINEVVRLVQKQMSHAGLIDAH